MWAYFTIAILSVVGSFVYADDSNYYRPHIAIAPDKFMGSQLSWDEVKRGQASGSINVVVTRDTKAFEPHHATWIDIPGGVELAAVEERCTGWMNAFIQGGYQGHTALNFREWDLRFHDKTHGTTFSGILEMCPRPPLTRQRIVSAQREGLIQAFTNKVVTLYSEDGPMVFVGPRFRNLQDFAIEWLSMSTTGSLKIPAKRQVTLEGDPCRPVGQVKVNYAGGTYWVRGLDLDITMGGEKLAVTPLGSGAWVLCDD